MSLSRSRIVVWVVIGIIAAIQLVGIVLAMPRFDSKPSTNKGTNTLTSDYYKAKVIDVKNVTEDNGGLMQQLNVVLLEGQDVGKTISIKYSVAAISASTKELKEGEQLFVTKNKSQDAREVSYTVFEKYRLDTVLFVTIIFALIIFAVGGWRGLGALASLAVSIAVILLFAIPQLAAGTNILLITIVSAAVICTVSMFLSHGWNARTRYALIAALFTLLTAINLSIWFVEAAKLTGLAGEESQYLQFSNFSSLNFVGVVIASVIIASIGVLDDVTSSQAAVVDELQKANPSLTVWELFGRSMSVGREHIASMVNSLILVYLGTSFATFLVLFGGKLYPLGVTLNLEKITQEIISSLVVSLCLTLAVPITSFLTAVFLKKGAIGRPSFQVSNFLLTKK
jgi:uncharacterized membrane protein